MKISSLKKCLKSNSKGFIYFESPIINGIQFIIERENYEDSILIQLNNVDANRNIVLWETESKHECNKISINLLLLLSSIQECKNFIEWKVKSKIAKIDKVIEELNLDEWHVDAILPY